MRIGLEKPRYRFSGHETFPCRYAWLPKAVEGLRDDGRLFAKTEDAMVRLGLGKNMVQALRFWVQAMGVGEPESRKAMRVSEFGELIFGPDGLDPYLEDVRTLWLLHWQLCSHIDEPLFAWDFLLNRYHEPEILRSRIIPIMEREAQQLERPLSKVTLAQHFDVFLHTYFPTRGRKGEVLEENLDCPLVELELVLLVGEARVDGNQKEPVYAFRRDEKPEITPELFAFCIDDFWNRHRPHERSLTLHDVAHAAGSPGQIFKLPESDVRLRLGRIDDDSNGTFGYSESAMAEKLTRDDSGRNFLIKVYEAGCINA